MPMSFNIRSATPDDAEAILAIYRPYVENTAITFEYDVPKLGLFRARIVHTLQRFPYLVAEECQKETNPGESNHTGRILGYAYASPFKDRAAYQWAVETSIYVDSSLRHGGIGSALHQALEDALRQQGILNLNACIAYPPTPLDKPVGTERAEEAACACLPSDSVAFHQRMGYRPVAHFHRCGKKHGLWYDMIWMEKLIGNHPASTAY